MFLFLLYMRHKNIFTYKCVPKYVLCNFKKLPGGAFILDNSVYKGIAYKKMTRLRRGGGVHVQIGFYQRYACCARAIQ